MNSFERVMNTIQGKPVDRVPVFAVLSAYGARLTKMPMRKLYSDLDTYVAGQKAIQDTFALDMVLSPFDYSILGESFGGTVAWFGDQPPNMKRFAANNVQEALALGIPDPFRCERIPFLLNSTKELHRLYGKNTPIFAVLPGPSSFPILTMGLEAWMNAILFESLDAHRLLARLEPFYIELTNALFAAGITALVVTEGMAAQEVMPRAMFQEFFLPYMTRVLGQVPGPVLFHHNGGRINHVLDLLPELPNLLGASVSSHDDLQEARKLLGPKRLLVGNLEGMDFPRSEPSQIFAQGLACLRTAVPEGPFILCNSSADIPLQADPATIHSMREASIAYAKEQGQA